MGRREERYSKPITNQTRDRPVVRGCVRLACFISKSNQRMKTEIQLPAAELKTALTGLGKLVYRHATLPVLQHVRLTRKNEDGAVQLQATDLDSFLTYSSMDLQPGPDVDVLIPIDAITKAIKGSKGCIAFVPEMNAVSICS